MSGMEALKLLDSRIKEYQERKIEMYKIVILDYSMPQMDGTQVALEIRKRL